MNDNKTDSAHHKISADEQSKPDLDNVREDEFAKKMAEIIVDISIREANEKASRSLHQTPQGGFA